jgi:hypothetical protein
LLLLWLFLAIWEFLCFYRDVEEFENNMVIVCEYVHLCLYVTVFVPWGILGEGLP